MLAEIGVFMLDQSLLALFSAFVALCSMVISVRYANVAMRAARQAEAVYMDELVRGVFLAANNIVAESMHADALAMGTLRDMHARTGEAENRRSHLDLLAIEAIKRDRDELHAVQKHARSVLENQQWRNDGKEGLLDLITKLEGNLVTVKRFKESFLKGFQSMKT